MMTDGPRATIHYGSLTYHVPAEVGENLIDVLLDLESLGGSHLFGLGGGDEPTVMLFITPGTPVAVQFDAGYKRPDERKNYVTAQLEMEARFRLGLDPRTGEPSGR